MHREKTDAWFTSDGRRWLSWHAANEYEKRLTLRRLLAEAFMRTSDPDETAMYLLSRPEITLIVKPLNKDPR